MLNLASPFFVIMKIKHTILLAIIGLSFSLKAQTDLRAMSEFVNATRDSFHIPSISMAVIKGDEVIFQGSFGVRSTEGDAQAVDQNSLYAIASLSKAFTAASIGMLVDEGKLDWDDKVVDHLPWFKMYDDYVTQHMTVSDLLCHRSGLITFDGDLLWYGTDYEREEIIKRIQYREPTYEFRTNFGYQNIMFMTAGEVIEAASGMSWDAFVKSRILDPLGMKNTTSSHAEFAKSNNIAEPHINSVMINKLSYDNSGATAALNSNVSDMTKWVQFWLNDGIVNGDTLISAKALKKIGTLHTPLNTGSFDARNGVHFKGYAQGWFVMDYNGKKVMHHGGGLPGYITKVALVPEENLGIVVLTNDMSSVPEMMMYMMIDWAMGKEDYQKWPKTFLDFKHRGEKAEEADKAARLATKAAKPDVMKNKAYVGRYRDAMYGDVVITEVDGELIFSMEPSKAIFTGKLSAWGDQQFRWDHKDTFLTYGIITFEADGKSATGFTIELPNYDFHFDKLNFKRVSE